MCVCIVCVVAGTDPAERDAHRYLRAAEDTGQHQAAVLKCLRRRLPRQAFRAFPVQCHRSSPGGGWLQQQQQHVVMGARDDGAVAPEIAPDRWRRSVMVEFCCVCVRP